MLRIAEDVVGYVYMTKDVVEFILFLTFYFCIELGIQIICDELFRSFLGLPATIILGMIIGCIVIYLMAVELEKQQNSNNE